MPQQDSEPKTTRADDASVTLDCVIERVTFHNPENGYSVVKVVPAETRPGRAAKATATDDLITILGHFSNPVVGESLRCWGSWARHPQYGSQFRLARYETMRPATADAIEKYLGSGMVKGVGPVMAKRIVAMFGDQSLDVIENAPKRLLRIAGIGEKRIDAIQAAWEEQREVREIMLFLQGHNVTPTLAVKIYRAYRERSIEVVERNPYQLSTDIWGIGFKTADQIARNLGIAPDAPARLEAGLMYVLNEEMEGGGHCYLPRETLIQRAAERLEADAAPVETALDQLLTSERLADEKFIDAENAEQTAIYLPSLQTTERAVAERIHALLHNPLRRPPSAPKVDAAIAAVPEQEMLSEEQRAAVRLALTAPVLVLTGGPGVGKTFTTRAIVAALAYSGKRILLASPTGRAAKRLAEMTGREAKTIHRLLAYDPEKRGFKHSQDTPLECDVLIVDEASMLDLMLTHYVLRALPSEAAIVFVGDVDQLPSVGPGNVLSDLIASEHVPVARLTQVFRQARQSRIITNAHAINQGEMPTLAPASEARNGVDCVFVPVEDADELPDKIAGIVRVSLPRLGFAADEITVLTPMQRGSCGARRLNDVLQGVLNPPSVGRDELRRGGDIVLRVGDRVLQRVNNYDKHVFNGDVGKITTIDTEEQTLVVDFPDGPVAYDFPDADQLTHAFAMTVHKSQGSEYPACVIALHNQHYMMLQRNVIYTALTRARRLAVFVGSKRALAMAIRSDAMRKRNTRLAHRLQLLNRSRLLPPSGPI